MDIQNLISCTLYSIDFVLLHVSLRPATAEMVVRESVFVLADWYVMHWKDGKSG